LAFLLKLLVIEINIVNKTVPTADGVATNLTEKSATVNP
jgi:hypothetical protein